MLNMTSMADPDTPSDEHNDQAATHFGSRRRAAAIQALDALTARSAPQGGSPTASTPAATTAAPAPSASVPEPAASPETAPPTTPAPAPAPAPAQPAAPEDEFAPLRKQEIHLRRQHAEELQRREAERLKELDGYKPKLARLDELESLFASGKDDPIALLRAVGFTDEDFEPFARLAYAHSPAGAKDPRMRSAAGQQLAQTKAQRELAAEQAKLRAEMEEFRQHQIEAQRRAEEQALIADYYQSVTSAIGDGTPHARYLLSRDPRGAQAQLLEIANRLYLESGPSDDLREAAGGTHVLKAYEASRLAAIKDALAELQALGIDPATLMEPPKPKPAPAPAPTTSPAPSSPSPSTLTPGGGAPTQIQRPGRKSRADLVADIERMTARR